LGDSEGTVLSGTPRELREPAENLQTTAFVALALALCQQSFSADGQPGNRGSGP